MNKPRPYDLMHPELAIERRHLELMAATIAAGLFAGSERLDEPQCVKWATSCARVIQAEVTAADEPSELSAICPVPPFPGIRGVK
jgi:hypothetical protein